MSKNEYRNAVAALRVFIEIDGMKVNYALDEVVSRHILGLAEINKLHGAAFAHYGGQDEDLQDDPTHDD